MFLRPLLIPKGDIIPKEGLWS